MSKMTTGLRDNGTTGLRKVLWSVVCGLWSFVAFAQLPPLPQDAPTIKTYQTYEIPKGATRQMQLVAVVVTPPKTFTLHWIQPDYDGEGWVWELYEYNPQTGRSTFRGMTSDTNYQVIATGDYQLFTVRANHLGVKGEPVK